MLITSIALLCALVYIEALYMYKNLSFLSVLALLVLFYSCKDDGGDEGPNAQTCTLKSELFISGNDTTELFSFAFDSQGRPLADASDSYSYPSSNEIVVNRLGGSEVHYALGSNGYPESAWQFPAPGTVNDTSFYSFTYDNNDRITELEITKGLVIGNVSSDILVTYQYQNNNLSNWEMNIIDPPTPQFSFDYQYGNDDMVMPLNPGFFDDREGVLDYWPGLNLYGTPIKKLPTQRTEGNEVKTYEYEFNDDGYITHFTSFVNGTKQIERWYDYDCE